MSRTTINDLAVVCAGVFGLALYAGLILVPAWTSYSRLWERVAASILSLYVLAMLVGIGVAAALARRLLLGLSAMPEDPSSDLAALDAITEAVESGRRPARSGARGGQSAGGEPRGDATPGARPWRSRPARRRRSARCSPRARASSSIPLRVADAVVGTLHMRAKTAPSASMQRLLVTMIASEVERVRAPERVSETAAADFLGALLAPRADRARGADRPGARAVAGGRGRSERDRRARAAAGAHRRGLARARARGRRAWRPRRRQSLDRGAVRTRRDGGRRGAAAGAGRRGAGRGARRRGGAARAGGRARRLHVRDRAQRGSRRIPPICRARSARRCSRRTSPRAAPTARRSPSSRRAPTGCC